MTLIPKDVIRVLIKYRDHINKKWVEYGGFVIVKTFFL